MTSHSHSHSQQGRQTLDTLERSTYIIMSNSKSFGRKSDITIHWVRLLTTPKLVSVFAHNIYVNKEKIFLALQATRLVVPHGLSGVLHSTV